MEDIKGTWEKGSINSITRFSLLFSLFLFSLYYLLFGIYHLLFPMKGCFSPDKWQYLAPDKWMTNWRLRL